MSLGQSCSNGMTLPHREWTTRHFPNNMQWKFSTMAAKSAGAGGGTSSSLSGLSIQEKIQRFKQNVAANRDAATVATAGPPLIPCLYYWKEEPIVEARFLLLTTNGLHETEAPQQEVYMMEWQKVHVQVVRFLFGSLQLAHLRSLARCCTATKQKLAALT